MTKEVLFDAVGQIDDCFVLAVADIVEVKGNSASQYSKHRIYRTILIAAIIASLLTAVAYATNWFGLGSTRMSTGDNLKEDDFLSHMDSISLNGIVGSPEYEASAEWLGFVYDYQNQKYQEAEKDGISWPSDDESWATAYSQYGDFYRLYTVYDDTMADKLIEIAGKYSLRVHEKEYTPGNKAGFLRLTGTENSIPMPGDEGWFEGYCFEDGSFVVSAAFSRDWQSEYSVLKNCYGSIPTISLPIRQETLDQMSEREYTTKSGAEICISREPERADGTHSVFVTYMGETSQVLAWRCLTGDESEDEQFAELFDFYAIDKAVLNTDGF